MKRAAAYAVLAVAGIAAGVMLAAARGRGEPGDPARRAPPRAEPPAAGGPVLEARGPSGAPRSPAADAASARGAAVDATPPPAPPAPAPAGLAPPTGPAPAGAAEEPSAIAPDPRVPLAPPAAEDGLDLGGLGPVLTGGWERFAPEPPRGPATLEVTVVDAQEKPVPGAEVILGPRAMRGQTGVSFADLRILGTTDEQGRLVAKHPCLPGSLR